MGQECCSNRTVIDGSSKFTPPYNQQTGNDIEIIEKIKVTQVQEFVKNPLSKSFRDIMDNGNQLLQNSEKKEVQFNINNGLTEEQKKHMPADNFALPTDNIPDYTSDTTRFCIQKYKDYVYNHPECDDKDMDKVNSCGKMDLFMRGTEKIIWLKDSAVSFIQMEMCMMGSEKTTKHMAKDCNGAKYEGDWVDDKQEGNGVEIWSDGAKYEGQYKDGKKHGEGIFYWTDGSKYMGQFCNNEIDGFGTYEWGDGRKYSGEWCANKMHGKGCFTWPDGRKYEGDYEQDKKHGYGEFQWADKRMYKGYWQNGKQHGRGVYIGKDGQQKEGEWDQGKRLKWITENQNQNNEQEDTQNI